MKKYLIPFFIFTIFFLAFHQEAYGLHRKPKMEYLKLNGVDEGIKILPNDTVKIEWHGIDRDDATRNLGYQLYVGGKIVDLDPYSIEDGWMNTTSYSIKFNAYYSKRIYVIKVIGRSRNGKTDSITRTLTIQHGANQKPKMEWIKLNGSTANSIEIRPHETVKIQWHGSDAEDDKVYYDVEMDDKTAVCEEYNDKSRIYRFEEAKTYTFKVTCRDSGGKTDTMKSKIKVKRPPQDHKPKMEWIRFNGSSANNLKLPVKKPVTITWLGSDQEDNELNYQLYIDNDPQFESVWSKKKQFKKSFDRAKIIHVKVICQDSGGRTDTMTKSFRTTNNKPTMHWLKLNGSDQGITVYADNPVKISWHATDVEDDDSKLTYKLSYTKFQLSDSEPLQFKDYDLGHDTSYTFNLDRYEDSMTLYVIKVKCMDSANQSDSLSRRLTIKITPENFKPKMEWIKLNNSSAHSITIQPNSVVRMSWEASDHEDNQLKYQLFIDNQLQSRLFADESNSDTWSGKKNFEHRFTNPKTYTVKVTCKDSDGKTDSMTRRVKVEKPVNTKPKMEWLTLNGKNGMIAIPPGKTIRVQWLGTDKEDARLRYKLTCTRFKADLNHLIGIREFPVTEATEKTLDLFKEVGIYVIKVQCIDRGNKRDQLTRKAIVKQ